MNNTRQFIRRVVGFLTVIILGVVGFLWLSQVQQANEIVSGQGISTTRENAGIPTIASNRKTKATPILPIPYPSATYNTPLSNQVLWLDDCNPEQSANPCDLQNAETFQPLRELVESVGGDLIFGTPSDLYGLMSYSVVIANFCGNAGNYLPYLRGYIANGGSVVVMGDEFCRAVPPSGMTSGQTANLLTRDWGIDFSRYEVDVSTSGLQLLPNPVTNQNGHLTIYRFTPLQLTGSATQPLVVSENGDVFMALYDGEGTFVTIPDSQFHRQNDVVDDRYQLWGGLFAYLMDSARAKNQFGTVTPNRPPPTRTPDGNTPTPYPMPTITPYVGDLPATTLTPTPSSNPITPYPMPTITPYVGDLPATTLTSTPFEDNRPTPTAWHTPTPFEDNHPTPTAWYTPTPWDSDGLPTPSTPELSRLLVVLDVSPSSGAHIEGESFTFNFDYFLPASAGIPQATILFDLVPDLGNHNYGNNPYAVFTPFEMLLVESTNQISHRQVEAMPALGNVHWDGTATLVLRVRMMAYSETTGIGDLLIQHILPEFSYTMDDWAQILTPPPTTLPLTPDLNNTTYWLTYAGNGFSIAYPPDYTLYPNSRPLPSGEQIAEVGVTGIVSHRIPDFVMSIEQQPISPEMTLEAYADNDDPCNTTTSGTVYETVGGVPALRFPDTNCGLFGADIIYVIVNGAGYKIAVETSNNYSQIGSQAWAVLNTMQFIP